MSNLRKFPDLKHIISIRAIIYCISSFMILVGQAKSVQAQSQPNIMVIITDDMGVDAMSVYGIGAEQPNTPVLDGLMSEGILFNNAWGYGKCSPSRATMLTGRYGNKNGVMKAGSDLPQNEVTIFEHIEDLTNGAYADALFGKWHLGNAQSPNDQGVDHFVGYMGSGVGDYNNWQRTENGVTNPTTEYVTTHLTDEAIGWVDDQTQPWLLWMAYSAPKGDNLPPDSLYTRTDTTTSLDRFLCRIESVDHEVGRLYNSLTQQEKDNTFILFVGDNGTSNSHLQGFANGHGKNTVYEGGIRLPMFVTGYGVTRVNEQEDGMVSFTDVFATITEMLGEDLPGGVDNSFSFYPLLSEPDADTRDYNYSELGNSPNTDRAIRNEQYKLIDFLDGTQEFYDLLDDPLEETNLFIGGLTPEQLAILEELEVEMDNVFTSWSCNDGIQNGDEDDVDCGGSFCTPCPGGPTTIFAHYFENDWDGWTSGGNDCARYSGSRSYEGNYSIRIRDNSGNASSMVSSTYDLSSYTSAEISFHFNARSMESGEDFFLEIDTGSGWEFLGQYVSGVDFINNNFTQVTVPINTVSGNTKFKFTCDASDNKDRIYIDAITLTASTTSLKETISGVIVKGNESTSSYHPFQSNIDQEEKDEVFVYPNPTAELLTIQTASSIKQIRVVDINGQIVIVKNNYDTKQLDVSNLTPGIYYIVFKTNKGLTKTRFIKL